MIRGARQLLTLNGPPGPRRGAAMRNLGIVEDGAVLVSNGTIASIGPSRRVENLAEARGAREIDVTGRVVMPGFVDSHTHLVGGAARFIEEDPADAYLPVDSASGGFFAAMRQVRRVPARSLHFQAMKIAEGCARHGTTTLESKSGYGLDYATEMKILRVLGDLDERPLTIVPTYLGAHITPPEFVGRPNEYIDWICHAVMPRIRERHLCRFADVLCDPAGFDLDQTRRYLSAAAGHGFDLKLEAEEWERTGAVSLALEHEAAAVAGLNHATVDDARLLGASDTIATLLPGKVFHGAVDRFAPSRTFIEHGVGLALASGFEHGVCPTYSMQMILSLACTQMRMTPAEAITAATINSACAVRVAARTGTLQCGKDADLIVLNVSDYREIPYYFGVNLVSLTIKKGKIICREPEILCGTP
ncbi:MAG: imidazolonepropionase [Acidobacteria bacterium]|nr:imidazolonepropionase [Acidobacteriota bacterium]